MEHSHIPHSSRLLTLSFNYLEIFILAEKFKLGKFIQEHNELKGFLLTLKDTLNSDFSLIFGSYASGEETKNSDLDLLIVSSNDDVINLNKAKSLLSIEVNPIFIRKKDFLSELKRGHRLYKDIVNGKRIIVNGEYNFWNILLSLG